MVFQAYNSVYAISDIRDPIREARFPINDDGNYLIANVGTGRITVPGYHDTNENGILDKNFIDTPTEAIVLTNNYHPRGPAEVCPYQLGTE